MFFYNPCGGKQIGVLWKPESFKSCEFRILAVNGQSLVDDELKYDHEQLKNDFKIIGFGLVENIVDNRNQN